MTGRTYRNYDSLVTWVDGSRVHLQQSVDITALVSANTDELTGMLSRRAGKERLGISLARLRSRASRCPSFYTTSTG